MIDFAEAWEVVVLTLCKYFQKFKYTRCDACLYTATLRKFHGDTGNKCALF